MGIDHQGRVTRGISQKAYQILVATSSILLAPGKADLWDSGQVASDESAQAIYGGKPLASRMEVWWTVRIWDQNGAASDWSEPAMFSMGLLQPADWSATWIGKDETAPLQRPDSPYWNLQKASWIESDTADYQRTFDIPAGLRSSPAILVIGAQDQYELLINGLHANRGSRPGWRTCMQRRGCMRDRTKSRCTSPSARGAMLFSWRSSCSLPMAHRN